MHTEQFLTVEPRPRNVLCVIPQEKPEVKVTNRFVISNGTIDLCYLLPVQRSQPITL